MGFSKKLFEDQLQHLDRGVRSISTISNWLSFYAPDAQLISECWVSAVESSSDNETRMVCLLYVAHEVLMLTRKMPLTFAAEFGKILPKMLPPLCNQHEHPEFLRIIATLTKIWKNLHIFPNETSLTLEKLVAAYPPYGTLLNTTTYFPELIQISKQLEESHKVRENFDAVTKRRKLDPSEALMNEELAALEAAADSLRSARKLVSDVCDTMTDNMKRIESDIQVFKDHKVKVTELLARNASSATRIDDILDIAVDQLDVGRTYERGEVVQYRNQGGTHRATVILVDRSTAPFSYQVRLENGTERFTEASHLKPVHKQDLADDLDELFPGRADKAATPPPIEADDEENDVEWNSLITPIAKAVFDAFSVSAASQ
eukprot:TRINITY_DN11776_c0_g1_i1.p1 TRINITY_DN11776_c0_g1~~TRINITY_DN11776_c0_g1_i1.p1  ORF type:complete len:374 (+),score=64.16 TRINITY_DN11776_c0_g1_i1:46-1167(+)